MSERFQHAQAAPASEVAQLIHQEALADRVRLIAHTAETERCRGVSWSGLSPEPRRPRSRVDLEADALAGLARLRAWRRSPVGRFVRAVAQGQRAALAAHAACEQGRAALSRDFEAELSRCAELAAELEAEARKLLAAAALARRAVRSAQNLDAPAAPA